MKHIKNLVLNVVINNMSKAVNEFCNNRLPELPFQAGMYIFMNIIISVKHKTFIEL